MAIFKCKMCGGDLNITEDNKVVECEYCGTQQTIPSPDNEKKMNLFNRANRLRLNSEFDKAAGIYENIIAEFPEEAEAYWGLILSNYGIEYVDDPATAKKIPTCHRASFTKIADDENFALAMEYADIIQQRLYRNEARVIDEIMENILSISRNEKLYDIFICYKETDEKGERTIDSVIGYDIYEALTAKGYKVFFSRVSLEDKLGKEYEPYIFAALNSAKIMLSLGTKYEYYHAVWVKNEWSRFLKLMASDKSKTLIPCFKDMDAYDMPDEFRALQAQDMGKVGAMQDLVRGIEKILGNSENAATQSTAASPVIVQQSGPNAEHLLERAFMFLEDGEWEKADDFCEQVLNLDPKCARAYLGKLMAELRVRKQTSLKDCKEPFDGKNNYQKVVRFADDKLKEELKGYNTYIRERNEEARKNDVYSSAKSMMSGEKTAPYEEAINVFKTIPGWKDANEQIVVCQKKIGEIKAKEEADRLEAERKAEERRIAAEKAAKKRKKIVAAITSIITFALAFAVLIQTVILPKINYLKMKNYSAAKVGDYVYFGSYEQDNNTSNGKEEIEWQVLKKEKNKILVISKYALDCQQYNSTYTDATWETCSLRKWLNGKFIKNAFSADEQAAIATTKVSADKNPKYDTDSGNATKDKVFLLSIAEAKKYFTTDKSRKCAPTAYAKAQGTYTNDDYKTSSGEAACWWWLRSPGSGQNYAASVGRAGSVNYGGTFVSNGYGCVRPALWINLEG